MAMWLKLMMNQMVRQAAEQQVRRWLDDTGKETPTLPTADTTSASSQTGGEISAAELVADVLLVFGSQAEAGGWIDGGTISGTWPIEGGRLVRGEAVGLQHLTWIPPQQPFERSVAERLIELVKPRLVVVSGFGIGLAEEVGKGLIVVGNEVSDESGTLFRSVLSFEAMCDDPKRGVKFGRIITLANPPKPGADRLALCRRTDAILAEPDGVPWIELCTQQQVPWIAIRIATEGAEELPSIQLRSLLDQATISAKIGAAVGSLWQEPASAKELWRIQEDGLQGSDRLAKFLRSFLRSLS